MIFLTYIINIAHKTKKKNHDENYQIIDESYNNYWWYECTILKDKREHKINKDVVVVGKT